jgi:hypothetical protein
LHVLTIAAAIDPPIKIADAEGESLNASATSMQSAARRAGPRAEHISIEGEPDPDLHVAPGRQPHRITRQSYTLASRLRGCTTELAILEGWYLGVRCVRPDQAPSKYQVDLRFANPKPVRVRHISWTWLTVSLGLALLGGGALMRAWTLNAALLSTVLLGGAIAMCVSLCALFLFLRRTTESLEFHSVHGGATLVSVTGGVGSARGGKKFFVELIKAINAAKLARPQEKAQFLRDEMREHHRLRELGVLTDQQYEQSKARILAEH